MLLWLYRYTDQLGQQFYLGSGGGRGGAVGKEDNERDEFVLACTSSLTNKELIMLVEFARVAGLVDCDPPRRTEPTLVSLSFSGYEKVSELLTLNIDSQQAFVAMWFDSEMDGVFEQAIAPAIKDVGYRPVIINQKQHNNHIVEEIIAEIRRSKFVIADFTCGTYETTEKDETGKQVSKELPRGGVYFEAGFAKGLGREVIWTVRFDKLKYVHFDTAQYNFIVWDSLEDLRKKLAIRIAATIGDGPLRKLN